MYVVIIESMSKLINQYRIESNWEIPHNTPPYNMYIQYILSDDVHKLQPGTDEEDYVFDVGRGEPATLQRKHLFHFMFLNTQIGVTEHN